jgi:hypothetical protein
LWDFSNKHCDRFYVTWRKWFADCLVFHRSLPYIGFPLMVAGLFGKWVWRDHTAWFLQT